MTKFQNERVFRRMGAFVWCCVLLWFLACQTGGGGSPQDKADLAVSGACASTKCDNPSAICCGGEPCIDVMTNTEHCGGCGKNCRSREACNAGSCVCTGGGRIASCSTTEACCGTGCRDITSDVEHCGGCGLACRPGEVCESGQCKCGPAGIACKTNQVCCGAVCSDPKNDAKNCGTCGKECKPGKACKNGLCEGECVSCPAGQTCCDGTCANLLNDNKNCGKCGVACKDVFGIPLPCLFGICAFTQPDMPSKDL